MSPTIPSAQMEYDKKAWPIFLVKCLIKNRMFSFSLELLIRAIPENIVEYS